MKRIFIKKIAANYNPINSTVETNVEFFPDILNIATVNAEFRDFLGGFFRIWNRIIRDNLADMISDYLRPSLEEAETYFDYNQRILNLDSVLRIVCEDIADKVEEALANKFEDSAFSTIDLVYANVPVKYYRFKSDINNTDFVYMPVDALRLKRSVLGEFSYYPVRKRTVRI